MKKPHHRATPQSTVEAVRKDVLSGIYGVPEICSRNRVSSRLVCAIRKELNAGGAR